MRGRTRRSLPSPTAAVWKLLAAAADSHTLSFLLMLNTGNQSVLPVETVFWDDKLGNSLPQPDRHVVVGKGALSTQTHLPAPVAQGSLTAVKLCVRARVRALLCYGCGSVTLGVQRLTGVSSLLC